MAKFGSFQSFEKKNLWEWYPKLVLIKFHGEDGIYEESFVPLEFYILFVNVMRLLYYTCTHTCTY